MCNSSQPVRCIYANRVLLERKESERKKRGRKEKGLLAQIRYAI
jgi:hypothetical protein